MLSRAVRAAGQHNTGVEQIPDGLTTAVVRCSRNSWTTRPGEGKDAEVIEVTVEVRSQTDPGWPFQWSFGAPGGDLFDRMGNLVVESSIKFQLPEGTGRQIRARIEGREALDFALDIDVD